MDVKTRFNKLITVAFCFLFVSCNKNKTVDAVFYEKQTPECYAEAIKNQFLVKWLDGNITLESAENEEDFIEHFAQPYLEYIERIEYNKIIKIKKPIGRYGSFSTEYQTKNQFVLSGTQSPTKNWGTEIVSAQYAWDNQILGQNILVGIVDTLLDPTHPSIKENVYINQMEQSGLFGVDDDNNGFVDDINGWDFYHTTGDLKPEIENDHATHIAGIIVGNHSINEVFGVAPAARVINANFMSQLGGGDLATAIKAINYVVQQGAKVVNLSWGGNICSESLKETLVNHEKNGVLFVTASGNEHTDFDYSPPRYWSYPAGFNIANQLVVAASSFSDYLAEFSNKSFSLVHIGAPGVAIYSSVPSGYKFLDGTSMSAPFVSGAAALLFGVSPDATPLQIKKALLSSVDIKDYKVLTQGRLNIKKSVEELKKIVP